MVSLKPVYPLPVVIKTMTAHGWRYLEKYSDTQVRWTDNKRDAQLFTPKRARKMIEKLKAVNKTSAETELY